MKTVYVDRLNGDDESDGLSPGTALFTPTKVSEVVEPGDNVEID